MLPILDPIPTAQTNQLLNQLLTLASPMILGTVIVMLKYITSGVMTLLIGFEKVAENILSKPRSNSKG